MSTDATTIGRWRTPLMYIPSLLNGLGNYTALAAGLTIICFCYCRTSTGIDNIWAIEGGGELSLVNIAGRLLLAAALLPGVAVTADSRPVNSPFKDRDGRKVSVRDLRGKIVVLNFWATWCVPCRAEMPMLVEAEKRYAPRGVAFVAVSLDDRETRQKIPDFIGEFKIGFPVWVGGSTMDLEDLKLGQSLPATAFLDREGRIAARVLGQVSKDELYERLDWLIGNRTGPAPDPLVRHVSGN
jgi:thiol-disulfide isomerase/thioredoxin